MGTTSETIEKIRGWLSGRVPQEWFESGSEGEPLTVTVDREEITVIGRIAAPKVASGASDAERDAAISGRISAFREETREHRMEIARELEHRSDRKVAWGVECGDHRQLFTTLSVPVMTRLRQPERQVLDTLVAAGVARSRSEALAWCVKLTGRNTDAWLADLRAAMAKVDEVRTAGPDAG